MFEKGECIVYGNNGPCMITDVTKLKMPGCDKKRVYYVLQPVRTAASTIYVPVDNEKVPVRKVMDLQEAENFWGSLDETECAVFISEKQREEEYKDILKSNDLTRYASMMKALLRKQERRKAEGRKFTSVDEKYLKEVKRLIRDEMALVLHRDLEDVDKELVGKLSDPIEE